MNFASHGIALSRMSVGKVGDEKKTIAPVEIEHKAVSFSAQVANTRQVKIWPKYGKVTQTLVIHP